MRSFSTRILALSVAFAACAAPMAVSAASSASSASSAASVSIKSGEHVRGRKSAQITIVEYSDLQCPFCQAAHPVLQKLIRKYRTKISWMYRHYPLDFHQHAQSAAEASECAGYLGGDPTFWSFADTLMAMKTFTPADYPVIAKRFGLNEKAFNQCVAKHVFASKVNDQKQGGVKAGVEGTPTVFIVNRKGRYQEKVSGAQSYETYTAIIERMIIENLQEDLGLPTGLR